MPINMSKKAINRLKAVLAEQGKTNKWLAEQLDKNATLAIIGQKIAPLVPQGA